MFLRVDKPKICLFQMQDPLMRAGQLLVPRAVAERVLAGRERRVHQTVLQVLARGPGVYSLRQGASAAMQGVGVRYTEQLRG